MVAGIASLRTRSTTAYRTRSRSTCRTRSRSTCRTRSRSTCRTRSRSYGSLFTGEHLAHRSEETGVSSVSVLRGGSWEGSTNQPTDQMPPNGSTVSLRVSRPRDSPIALEIDQVKGDDDHMWDCLFCHSNSPIFGCAAHPLFPAPGTHVRFRRRQYSPSRCQTQTRLQSAHLPAAAAPAHRELPNPQTETRRKHNARKHADVLHSTAQPWQNHQSDLTLSHQFQ